MKKFNGFSLRSVMFAVCLTAVTASATQQTPVALGLNSTFAILAGTTVTVTGGGTITGNIGISPGTAFVAGVPAVTVDGTVYAGGPIAAQAQADLTVAFNDAAGRQTPALVAGNLGGLTLTPGLYKSTSSLEISSGDLTLDAQGNPKAVFIFQIATTFTMTSGRQVILSGGANPANIFWQVGSSATLGTTSVLHGNILAAISISMLTGATLDGRALAQNGAVTVDTAGGNSATVPVTRRAKAGIFRSAAWTIDQNGNGVWNGPGTDRAFFWGQLGDVPVSGDWNGSGTTKAGVVRPDGTWILDYNGNDVFEGGDRVFSWGQTGDIPIVGDWNGSGTSKAGVIRGWQWILDYNGNGVWDGPLADRAFFWGQAGDIPVIGDWSGSGTIKAGVVRAGQWIIDYNGNGAWDGPATDRAFFWGQPNDVPVVGDWNGSGTAKAGIIRANGLWALDYNGNGVWDGPTLDRSFFWGQPSDIPVVGDWYGSGSTKVGVVRSGQWILDYNGTGVWEGPGVDRAFFWGESGDFPVAGKW